MNSHKKPNPLPSLSVVIVTLDRLDCLRQCLECLQKEGPEQTIVVDGSLKRDAEVYVREAHPEVIYLRNPEGYGHMTGSRNIGLRRCLGDIVAFVDDDAFVHPGWKTALLEPYTDVQVGGVGGRALNGMPGEETEGLDRIGRLTASGAVEGFFAADPGECRDVDHLIGCNMSWRRQVLAELGGLRELFPGTEVREETDIALRVRTLGYRLVFNPAAVVTHVGSPQVKGRRFDTRYVYFGSRNHAVLLWLHGGPGSVRFWRWIGAHVVSTVRQWARSVAGATLRAGAAALGLIVGLAVGGSLRLRLGADPRGGAPGICSTSPVAVSSSVLDEQKPR